jgi:hypothetical protein
VQDLGNLEGDGGRIAVVDECDLDVPAFVELAEYVQIPFAPADDRTPYFAFFH